MAAPQNFNTFTSETSNVRDVSEDMLLLDENRDVLYVLTNKNNRKKPVHSPRIEWFEEADLGLIGTVSAAAATASNATQLFVIDVTLFGVNDVVQVGKTAGTISTADELVLVTAVSGTTNGTLTVTRAFASSTADTVGASNVLKILGVATTEGGSIDNPRVPSRSPKTSGCQIFEWPISITRTGAATKVYAAPQGDRDEKQILGMRRQRLEIENAGLFGKFAETLSGTSSRYTSMGVKSIISTNVSDAGGTLTYGTFLSFSRNAFRFGGKEKLLCASVLVKEGLDYIAANKQMTKSEQEVFGISLNRFVVSGGTWLLAANYNMDGGNADEALGIDLPSVAFRPLVGNGINCDTKIFEDYDPTNPKIIKDLVFTQAGWQVRHESRHAKLYDVSAYA
jgi:hypothetical protein